MARVRTLQIRCRPRRVSGISYSPAYDAEDLAELCPAGSDNIKGQSLA